MHKHRGLRYRITSPGFYPELRSPPVSREVSLGGLPRRRWEGPRARGIEDEVEVDQELAQAWEVSLQGPERGWGWGSSHVGRGGWVIGEVGLGLDKPRLLCSRSESQLSLGGWLGSQADWLAQCAFPEI